MSLLSHFNSSSLGLVNVVNHESLAFENKMKHRVYVRPITRCIMYEKNSILLAGTGVRKISSVACGFSPKKSVFLIAKKKLISRINEVYVFICSINFICNRLICCKHTCYCVGMVSVTSASRYQSKYSSEV